MSFRGIGKNEILVWIAILSLIGAIVFGVYLNHWATRDYYKQNYIFEQDCDLVRTKFGMIELCAKKVNSGKRSEDR